MKGKREPRWKRLHRVLYAKPCTSMEIIHKVGTVTPSKCVSELRQHGVDVYSRVRGDGNTVYWVRTPEGFTSTGWKYILEQ